MVKGLEIIFQPVDKEDGQIYATLLERICGEVSPLVLVT